MVGAHPEAKAVKSATAFRTISEVSGDLDVPQHVLRFWETKFSQIRPLKRGGGRRYYRPEDVDLLRRIQHLLYKEGYTIKGVQRLLRESRGLRNDVAVEDEADEDAMPSGEEPDPELEIDEEAEGVTPGMTADQRNELESILHELMTIRELLRIKL